MKRLYVTGAIAVAFGLSGCATSQGTEKTLMADNSPTAVGPSTPTHLLSSPSVLSVVMLMNCPSP